MIYVFKVPPVDSSHLLKSVPWDVVKLYKQTTTMSNTLCLIMQQHKTNIKLVWTIRKIWIWWFRRILSSNLFVLMLDLYKYRALISFIFCIVYPTGFLWFVFKVSRETLWNYQTPTTNMNNTLFVLDQHNEQMVRLA